MSDAPQSWRPVGRKAFAHVATDVAAIAGIVSLSLWGELPSWAAAAIVATVQGAYVIQARRPGPPSSLLVSAAYAGLQAARAIKG